MKNRTSLSPTLRFISAFLVASMLTLTPLVWAAEMLGEGDLFPSWELSDHNGKLVRSSELAGQRYLLWFYPRANTPGCTAEGRGLRDKLPAFESLGIRIFGVSFDPPDRNKSFAEEESFPFALLSDTERSLAVQVGAADSQKSWWAKRISYLVAADGTVEKAFDDVSPSAHAEEVLEQCSEKAPGLPATPAPSIQPGS